MFCKNCGNKLDDDALFCMNCGVKIADDTSSKYCAHCGNALDADALFCMNCGNRIKEEQPQTEDSGVRDSQIKTTENIDSVAGTNEEKLQNEKTVIEVDKTAQEEKTELKDEPINESLSEGNIETTKDYKNLFCSGKHFVYIDDSSKVFCPKCHERTDINETLCSNCNTSFIVNTKTSTDSDELSGQEQKIVFDNGKVQFRNEQQASSTSSFVSVALIAIFIGLAVLVGVSIKESLEHPYSNSSNIVSNANNTFSFDTLKPYTFKSDDGSREYDCYSVSQTTLSDLWENPPKSFIYNKRLYEVDNKNIDYDDIDKDEGEYNVIICWGDYDGTYYHFSCVLIQNGRKRMWLDKL